MKGKMKQYVRFYSLLLPLPYPQLAFTYPKLTMEKLEQGLKYVQILTIKTPEQRH